MSFLGIDVGSSYIKLWHEDSNNSLLSSRNIHHRGAPREFLLDELSCLNPEPQFLSFSGNLAGQSSAVWRQEGILAEIDYIRRAYPYGKLLVFGAEKIEFVSFDENGHILNYRTNPACAAGTGSFLDEQMARLGLDFSDLPRMTIDDNAPLVATRCAVFAKTDIIHLQQEGHSAYSIYNGLCKGLVLSSLKSVFGGNLPDGSGIIATGGLLENPLFSHFLKRIFPMVHIADKPSFSRARGLCHSSMVHGHNYSGFPTVLKEHAPGYARPVGMKPLKLKKSCFPAEEITRGKDEYQNEIWHDLNEKESITAFIGVDIGSTSTKAVLIDDHGAIRLDIYTRTSGNPIEATKRIFRGIKSLQNRLACSISINGCATTGSGRKLVGTVLGADVIVNEISAHAKGALTLDDRASTIFEIGGQDAKFIRLDKGRIVDVNMNYVCAAGTGSFIEEQARTLGMGIEGISSLVQGALPLPNSDRCTVFMNHEITRQVALGYPKDQIMAGVMVAVFKNYISKVVGNRSYSKDRIVFQGATARNRGLVATLEQITGAQVIVSPFCHVMGAYGAALIARDKSAGRTSFRGFELPDVSIRETACRGCENTCRITYVKVEHQTTSWGYMCGREPGNRSEERKVSRSVREREDMLKTYEAKLQKGNHAFSMPALCLYEEFLPFLSEIAEACDLSIEVCYPSKSDIIKELSTTGSGDFCYPAKVAMACVSVLLRKDPAAKILLPFLLQDFKDESIKPRSLYCPFITAVPGFFKDRNLASRIFTPEIDLSKDVSWQASRMRSFLKSAGISSVNPLRLRNGIRQGLKRLRLHRDEYGSRAARMLQEIGNEKAIVIMGRSYNLYHQILNLGIPELTESLGCRVITMDAVPDEVTNQDVSDSFPDMYWLQGQRLLKKALSIRNHPNLFPLMISNFSCGPDSFILTFLEEIFRDKPYLILELDEHGSATGYQTRIEAFIDMIEQCNEVSHQPHGVHKTTNIFYDIKDIRYNTKVWIPQIHPYIPQLWSAVLNSHGFETEAMGEESQADCIFGRSLCRGSECLPAALTTGKFLTKISDSPGSACQALFMPRAEGPCRFGQYATLQSMIFHRAGLLNTIIFSPTSENGYSFLTPRMEMDIWKAICLGDALFKLRCCVMPYHKHPSMADGLIRESLDEICSLIAAGRDWKVALSSLVNTLSIDSGLDQPKKPLVGIVGEIFVRLNSFSNQHIVKAIEANGAEAWLTPMSEWILYIRHLLLKKAHNARKIGTYMKNFILHKVEHDIMSLFSPLLDQRHEPAISEIMNIAKEFFPESFEGEATLTLGRSRLFADHGAELIVNCSPFTCMPGRITSHIFQACQDYFKIPVVNLFFDGTGDVSGQMDIFLKSITQARKEHRPFVSTTFYNPRKRGTGKSFAKPFNASQENAPDLEYHKRQE